jgi:hypothetical protein
MRALLLLLLLLLMVITTAVHILLQYWQHGSQLAM